MDVLLALLAVALIVVGLATAALGAGVARLLRLDPDRVGWFGCTVLGALTWCLLRWVYLGLTGPWPALLGELLTLDFLTNAGIALGGAALCGLVAALILGLATAAGNLAEAVSDRWASIGARTPVRARPVANQRSISPMRTAPRSSPASLSATAPARRDDVLG